MTPFNGLGMHPGNLWQLSPAKTRSLSPENISGAKGQGGRATDGLTAINARELGPGWKLSPALEIPAGGTLTLADLDGPGALQSMWMGGTCARDHSRQAILRIYWDGQAQPSVECPLGDFFAAGWPPFAQLSSLPVAVNPNRGLNCFWEMPFRKHCRMTLENLRSEPAVIFYQINYTLTEVPEDAAYFHAQFRRVNPVPYQSVYTVLEGVRGAGQYVGTYLAVGVTNGGWWGEGEIKFYLDGDGDYPTICGTGTEDYFGGSFNWDIHGRYVPYSTPYLGMHQVIGPDAEYMQPMQRFGAYRWHIPDPVRFAQDLRVTLQMLGWRSGGRFLPLQCDTASVAYWYQTLPTAPFPVFPDADALEII